MVYSYRSRAISSAGERCLHTAEVAGSNPASPTLKGLYCAANSRGPLQALIIVWVFMQQRGNGSGVCDRLEIGRVTRDVGRHPLAPQIGRAPKVLRFVENADSNRGVRRVPTSMRCDVSGTAYRVARLVTCASARPVTAPKSPGAPSSSSAASRPRSISTDIPTRTRARSADALSRALASPPARLVCRTATMSMLAPR